MPRSLHTAQILGNKRMSQICIMEPYTSTVYTRRVLSGEFIVVNKHLLKDSEKEGLWTKDMRQTLTANNGSIQNINEIPQD